MEERSHCKMQNANCKLKIEKRRRSAFCNLHFAICILQFLFVLSIAGCTTIEAFHVPFVTADVPHGDVRQVLVLWGDGVVTQPDPAHNGVLTPGLAARVYLVGNDLTRMLVGDGSLAVLLYDGDKPLSENAVPKEVWNIKPDSLESVLSKDALGYGYNLWLPWSSYRQDIRHVRLVAKYQSKQGAIAYSNATDYAVRGPAGISTKVTKSPQDKPSAPDRSFRTVNRKDG
jgi:hypothetical protein